MSFFLKKVYMLLNVILYVFGFKIIRISKAEEIIQKFNKKHKDIKFLQVGANDGISFDFLYEVAANNNWQGVVVEPINDFYKILEVNYSNHRNIKALNIALHPNKKKLKLFRVDPSFFSTYDSSIRGIISSDINHLIKHNIDSEHVISDVVNCKPLMQLVHEEDLYDAMYLQVDTEGFDYEIIKMIDFNKWKPLMIRFESGHLNIIDKEDVFCILKLQGYIFEELGLDTIAYQRAAL